MLVHAGKTKMLVVGAHVNIMNLAVNKKKSIVEVPARFGLLWNPPSETGRVYGVS